MQSQPSNDKRAAKECTDRGRNAEQSAIQDSDRVAHSEIPDMANRTVCLSANLQGKGGLAT